MKYLTSLILAHHFFEKSLHNKYGQCATKIVITEYPCIKNVNKTSKCSLLGIPIKY